MRTWMIVAAAVALVAVAVLGYTSLSSGVPVEAVAATRATIQEYVDEEGKTRLAETYVITMPYDGRVEAIDLVEGTGVSKGQVVARIWPVDLELRRAAAQASIDRLKASIKENDDASVENTALKQSISMVEAIDHMVEAAHARVQAGEAQMEYAEKHLGRTQRLAKTGAKTEDDVDQAEVSQIESQVSYQQDMLSKRSSEAMQAAATLLPTMIRQYIQRKLLGHDVLEQQLAEAEVQLHEIDKDAKLGVMTSPVDGVVLERAVSNERPVSAGSVLLRIGEWDDLEIEADVLSQDVVRVHPGQRVEVHGPSIGPKPAAAEVIRIYPEGFTKTSSLGVEQQRVKVILKFKPEELHRLREQNHLGVHYRVRVRVFTADATDALVIPRSALFRGSKNDWQVYVIRGGRAHLQTVKVGLQNDESAQITDGLIAGEPVILAPESDLSEGQTVSPIDTGAAG